MMKKIILGLLVMLSASFASEGDGGYAGSFLRMGLGARAKAMGDALTALPEGATAGYYNPALLPHLESRQFMASFEFLPLDRSLDFIGYAMALQPPSKNGKQNPLKAGLALGWVHAGVDNIYGTDGSGNHIGDFENSEHAFYLSFALRPHEKFSIGISGKVLYNTFPKIAQEEKAVSTQGFGLDFGAYFTPIHDLSLSIVFKDKMSKYTWNTDKLWERGTSTTYEFPKVVRGGIAYRIPQQWLVFVADMETSDVQNPRYHFGAEFTYQDAGALRMGVNEGDLTFGFGFNYPLFGKVTGIDYAYNSSELSVGADHVFSWIVNF